MFRGKHPLPFSLGAQPRHYMKTVMPHMYPVPEAGLAMFIHRPGTWLSWLPIMTTGYHLQTTQRSSMVHFVVPTVEVNQ